MVEYLSFAQLSFIVALILALVNWAAVARDQRRLEHISKPATLTIVIAGIEGWAIFVAYRSVNRPL